MQSGRPVTIAVGRHTRMPRDYRGRDVLWWLDRMGLFDETVDQVYDPSISREQPSLQLVGDPRRVTLDLASLADRGVRVVGRLLDVHDGEAWFADDLVATTAAADIKLASLLKRIDAFIVRQGHAPRPAPPFQPHCLRFDERGHAALPRVTPASRRWSGQRGSRAPTRGCGCRCSPQAARSATAAA